MLNAAAGTPFMASLRKASISHAGLNRYEIRKDFLLNSKLHTPHSTLANNNLS